MHAHPSPSAFASRVVASSPEGSSPESLVSLLRTPKDQARRAFGARPPRGFAPRAPWCGNEVFVSPSCPSTRLGATSYRRPVETSGPLFPSSNPPPTALTAYHWKLLIFLSVATFFEGYDFIAIAQILPSLRTDFQLSRSAAGDMLGFINAGTIVAALLVRRADEWGRRRVLSITIVGYTLMSLLSALAPEALSFTLAQFVARIFLIGEWATAMVYAAEEFPADRRGFIIGVIQACSSLGGIVCAGTVPFLLRAPTGWRTVYLAGAIPLAIIAFARRTLRESSRFERTKAQQSTARAPLLALVQGPYRGRVFVVALAWALTYLCGQTAITFWKEFATSERSMTDTQVAGALTLAALVSLPMIFGVGRLLDALGRRMGAVIIFVLTSLGVALAYTLHHRVALTAALVLAIFGVSAVLPVLNAFTAELFPTEARSDAFAWCNNLLGRVGYVFAPVAVGRIAERTGWGPAVAATAVFPLLALGVILAKLPETRGRELEETSRLDVR